MTPANSTQRAPMAPFLLGEILTVAQAAEFLQVSDDVLYPMLSSGEIPAAKVRGQWRIIRSDLIDWMREQYAQFPKNHKDRSEQCPIAEMEAQNGGSPSREYDNLLGLRTTTRQKRSKPS